MYYETRTISTIQFTRTKWLTKLLFRKYELQTNNIIISMDSDDKQ